MGGYIFVGEAIDPSGEILNGDIIVFGPSAYFRSSVGDSVGMLSYRSGALEPGLLSFDGEYGNSLRYYSDSGESSLPLDASLGKAISLKEASDSRWQEHLREKATSVMRFWQWVGWLCSWRWLSWGILLLLAYLSQRI